MCYCAACCMQEWQESPLCPSPAAADLSKDIPATCILLTSPLHLPVCSYLLIHLKCVWVTSKLSVNACAHINCMCVCFFFMSLWLWFISFSDSLALSPLSAASIFLFLMGYFYFLLCVSLVFYRLLPVRVSVVLLIQVFLPTSGFSESGDHVRSPAASFLAHRALRCWAGSASTAGSPTQTLVSIPAVPDWGRRPVTRPLQFRGTLDAKGHDESSS